jgi:hypothetical protein
MEITEKERMMLVAKKEEILTMTKEIMDCLQDPKQAKEVKKKMTSTLSLVSTIASYAESKNYDLDSLTRFATMIFLQMDMLGKNWGIIDAPIQMFCNMVNSIQFNFAKRDIRIKIPKIDFSIFKQPRE